MKLLVYFLSIFVAAGQGFTLADPFFLFDDAYLLNEDFETTGEPVGWTSIGTPNYDYATFLEGTESLLLSGATNAYVFNGYSSGWWMKLCFKHDMDLENEATYAMELYDVATNAVCSLVLVQQRGTGTNISLVFPDMTTDGVTLWFPYTNTVWLHFYDLYCDIYVSATGVKPASRANTDNYVGGVFIWKTLVMGVPTGQSIVFDTVVVSRKEID